MQTEIQSEITQTTSKTIPLKTEHMGRWFKISLFSTLGLLSILFLVLLGLQFTKNQNPTVPNPVVIQPTFTPSPVTDSTANWKIYTNEKYGFQFKHPAETEVSQVSSSPYEQYKLSYMGQKQKDSGRTQTSLGDGYMFTVGIRELDLIDKVTQHLYSLAKENCYEETVLSSITDVKIGLIPAKTYSVTGCMGDYRETLVSNGSVIFEIVELYTGDEPEYSEYKKIANQVLSTFKFIESDSTANLKTYRSPFIGDYVYPFELSYSSEWTLDSKITSEDPKSLMVKLTKSDGSAINITQGMGGGGTCIYYDESDFETFEGMGGSFKSYVQLTKPALWRIGLDDEDSKYVVCEKVPNSRYLDGTKIGWINIVLKSDTSVQEIKKIFESIVFKPTSTTKTSFD